ncbi:hypothetical protein MKX03_005541 [Papaver bracteatum]|nr:hypothetical protein MKX03_005541 [Papaver bracteatum]
MATTVLPTASPVIQAPVILTLKDFQQKNEIGPWMARVCIVRMWHEIDFMKTNDVTILDLLLLDDTGDLLHAIIQKKFIWKFEPLIEEGMLFPAQNDYRSYFNRNTDITPLEASIVLKSPNVSLLLLTYVVGVMTIHTNLEQFKQNSGNASFMHELTLENLSGMKIKVTLWGDSTSELTRNFAAHEINLRHVIVVVVGVYASLTSTNAAKIYFDIDILEVLHIIERVGYNEASKSIGDTTLSISQLPEAKWESGYNMLNRKVCRAKAIGISTEKGWYYLGCPNYTTKLFGNTGDHWCPRCKVQIDEPVPRFWTLFNYKLLLFLPTVTDM